MGHMVAKFSWVTGLACDQLGRVSPKAIKP